MKTKKLDLLPLKALKVNDFFWNKYTGLVTKEIIPSYLTLHASQVL